MALKFLPDANFGVPVRQLQGGSGRASASEINDYANESRNLTATVAARGALLPILYGRRDVPGLVFAVGAIGGDLVVGYIWCIGEIDAVETLYLNDATVPGGVTVTHYTGTPTQGVDATLASAVPAYADTMRLDTPTGKRGVAYSVVRIPAGAISGWPRARAVCRGLQVYDERTLTTAYSDNPALCLADLASDTDFGPGLTVTGAGDAADWDDSLLGGTVERARMALYIAQGRSAPAYFDLMAEYAECFYVYEGAGIRLIPDSPVDLGTAPTVTAADMIAGTLAVSVDSSDSPTEVEVQYTEPASPANEPWGVESALPATLPGVDEGEISRIPTSITLEGVYRSVEASNKALARLNRMQDRVRVDWQTLDAGVVWQVGDVVNVDNAARGVSLPVRIESVTMVGAGRYRVSSSRYDASFYPSELILPSQVGTVPVGAIVMLSGSTVPADWAEYTAANGAYILGAGGANNPGDTGGAATATISGNTSTTADHLGASTFYTHKATFSGGQPQRFFASEFSTGAHSHTWTTGAITPDPLRRRNRLIIKTGTAGLQFPQAAQVFGLAGLVLAEIQRALDNAGRLLLADTVNANAGAASKQHAITTGAASDAHVHGSYNSATINADFGPFPPIYSVQSGGGSHTHTVTLTETPLVKRRRVALYAGIGDYDVIPGMIVMWSGSVGALPTDWVLCDGTGGTPDMRDHFVEISAAGAEGTAAGNNTVTAAGTTSSVGHSHKGGATSNLQYIATRHPDTVLHDHTVSGSVSWTPPFFALAFIMFAPAS